MEDFKEIDIVITLVAGTAILLFLVFAVIYAVIRYQKRALQQQKELNEAQKKYQNELLEATIAIAEQERSRISKNLHDEIGTLINVVKLNNRQQLALANKPEDFKHFVAKNNELLKEIDESVRSISNDLLSPTLARLGFMRALKQLVTQLNDSNTIRITFDTDVPEERMEQNLEVQLYRTVKEVINNIIRHSGASSINICIIKDAGRYIFSFMYDGQGITDQDIENLLSKNRGLGLKSIYGRVQVMQGHITYRKHQPLFEVRISIPILIANES